MQSRILKNRAKHIYNRRQKLVESIVVSGGVCDFDASVLTNRNEFSQNRTIRLCDYRPHTISMTRIIRNFTACFEISDSNASKQCCNRQRILSRFCVHRYQQY